MIKLILLCLAFLIIYLVTVSRFRYKMERIAEKYGDILLPYRGKTLYIISIHRGNKFIVPISCKKVVFNDSLEIYVLSDDKKKYNLENECFQSINEAKDAEKNMKTIVCKTMSERYL